MSGSEVAEGRDTKSTVLGAAESLIFIDLAGAICHGWHLFGKPAAEPPAVAGPDHR